MPIVFLRPREVARLRGVTRPHLYNEVKRGNLPPQVMLGARSSGWPEAEIQLLQKAILGGATEQQQQALVRRIIAARPKYLPPEDGELEAALGFSSMEGGKSC